MRIGGKLIGVKKTVKLTLSKPLILFQPIKVTMEEALYEAERVKYEEARRMLEGGDAALGGGE